MKGNFSDSREALSMGIKYDKPHYVEVQREDTANHEKKAKAIESIKTMLRNESFGVLATNAKNESYASLISFVTNEEATFLAFSTPIDTRKYRMIEKDGNVSLLIDNRSANLEDINQIAAITVIGKARIVTDKKEQKKWSQILIDKHSYLDDFICADTSAIILVEIETCHYVSSFQEVVEWSPNED